MADLTYKGATMTAAEWSRRGGEFGLPMMDASTIARRKRQGWTDTEALTTPPGTKSDAGRIAAKVSPWRNHTISPSSRMNAEKSGFRQEWSNGRRR